MSNSAIPKNSPYGFLDHTHKSYNVDSSSNALRTQQLYLSYDTTFNGKWPLWITPTLHNQKRINAAPRGMQLIQDPETPFAPPNSPRNYSNQAGMHWNVIGPFIDRLRRAENDGEFHGR